MKNKAIRLITLVVLVIGLNMYFVKAKNNQDEIIKDSYAKIISTNYINDEVIIILEVDNLTYYGKFVSPLSHDDYLALHHNQGVYINITYFEKGNYLMILNWFI